VPPARPESGPTDTEKIARQAIAKLIFYQLMNDRHFNKQLLRVCLEQDRYRFQPSAWKQLHELQISLSDALYVLRNGNIDGEAELDVTVGCWSFTMRGETADEKELTITFALVEIEGVLILSIGQ
jgi:hypothetical protein